MVLNSFILIYLTCSVLSLIVGVTAVCYGSISWKRWDINSHSEEQYRLEKHIYLIITILSIGLFMKIATIPLWFVTLHSMIISIPGAMCLAGVHNSHPHIAYVSSCLKIILPAFYFYWLIVNHMDMKIWEMPFMKHKLFMLIPLGIMIVVEAFLDINFFFSVAPRQVSCCTSLFDIPRGDIIQHVTDAGMVWAYLFCLLAVIFVGSIIYFICHHPRVPATRAGWWYGIKNISIVQTLLIISFITVFILALHTCISPVLLHAPFHHCIFCLFQKLWDVTFAFILIYAASMIFLSYIWITTSSAYHKFHAILDKGVAALLKVAALMLFAGLAVIAARILMEVI